MGDFLCVEYFDTDGWASGRASCKNLSDEVLAWSSVWSEVQMICIWSSWCHGHLIICSFVKIQTDLTYLVSTYPGCPGKKAVKWLSVCRMDHFWRLARVLWVPFTSMTMSAGLDISPKPGQIFSHSREGGWSKTICVSVSSSSSSQYHLLQLLPLLPLLLHPFNNLSSRTTWVSWHQKGKPFWILPEQEMMGWQWHQLDHMQIICTLIQTDNHASTSPHSFYRPDALPVDQSTEGKSLTTTVIIRSTWSQSCSEEAMSTPSCVSHWQK